MASTTSGVFELLTGSSSPLLASGDVVCFVDVSDTTQAAQGSLVKGTMTQFFAAIPVPVVVTSASANALAVGLAGSTNPAFLVDSSTALQAAGLKVVGAVAAGTVAISVVSSGAAANLSLNAKGTGTIAIGNVSSGAVTITPATTFADAVTMSKSTNGIFVGTNIVNAQAGTAAVASLHWQSDSKTATIQLYSSAFTTSGYAVANSLLMWNSGPGGIGFDASGGGGFTWYGSDTSRMTLSDAGLLAVPATGQHSLGPITFTNGAVSGITTLAVTSGLTLTGATITGAPTWSSNQAITLSTAAQPNITSVGTLTSLAAGAITTTVRLTSATTVGGTVFAATGMEVYANVGAGAVVAGFGTTYDVGLVNRSGTVVLGVTANATTITLPGYGSGGGAVSVGAADSGGAGFKVLRVPN